MMPGAVTPSSLVISITGFSLPLPVFFRVVFVALFLEDEVGWFAIFRAKVFFFFGMSKQHSRKEGQTHKKYRGKAIWIGRVSTQLVPLRREMTRIGWMLTDHLFSLAE
jgi:hypothetical protein